MKIKTCLNQTATLEKHPLKFNGQITRYLIQPGAMVGQGGISSFYITEIKVNDPILFHVESPIIHRDEYTVKNFNGMV